MIQLTEKLRAVLALDKKKAEKLYGLNSMSSMAEGSWCPIGALNENKRLAPIHEALLEVADSLRQVNVTIEQGLSTHKDSVVGKRVKKALDGLQKVLGNQE